jgi:hypothetical protein
MRGCGGSIGTATGWMTEKLGLESRLENEFHLRPRRP